MMNDITAKKPTGKQIYNLFAKLQIRHDLTGYAYVRDFINDYFDNNGVAPVITKWYKTEAARVGTTASSVESCINNVIKCIKTVSDDEEVEAFKNQIFATHNLANKAFLCALCHYFECNNDTDNDEDACSYLIRSWH